MGGWRVEIKFRKRRLQEGRLVRECSLYFPSRAIRGLPRFSCVCDAVASSWQMLFLFVFAWNKIRLHSPWVGFATRCWQHIVKVLG